jgi:hypothetical protein
MMAVMVVPFGRPNSASTASCFDPRPGVILIEDKASGTQLIQELLEEGVRPVTRYNPEHDKVMRMHAQTAVIENGFVYLPKAAHWLPEYLHELAMIRRNARKRASQSATLFRRTESHGMNIAPRHLKSLCASIALPAWWLGHDPAAQILCVSYAQDLADKLSRDARAVMNTPWYQGVFSTRSGERRPDRSRTSAKGREHHEHPPANEAFTQPTVREAIPQPVQAR